MMTTAWKQIGGVMAAAFLFVAVQAQASQDNQMTGEKLYKESCAPCHTERPAKMMGKPVDVLVGKMNKVKEMASPKGKVAQMQQVLKPLSEQQMADIATYLNGLK